MNLKVSRVRIPRQTIRSNVPAANGLRDVAVLDIDRHARLGRGLSRATDERPPDVEPVDPVAARPVPARLRSSPARARPRAPPPFRPARSPSASPGPRTHRDPL